MDILNEIIEVSNNIIETLDEAGFFEENPFCDENALRKNLQIKMQRKWEQQEEILLDENEFLDAINETISQTVSDTLSDLVDKGAVNMSIDADGEIIYSSNKDYNIDEL